MGYDLFSNPSTMYAELHQYELHALAAEARLARQAHVYVPRRLRRRLGALLISAGEALVYQPCEAQCQIAGARAGGHKHL